MAALVAAPSWDLLFVLPHANIPTPSPFNAGVVQLVAGNDPILAGLRDNPGNTTGRRMLDAFRGQKGQPYVPACLILDSNAPNQAKTAEALRAFRNISAVATILRSYANGPLAPQFSDHFDIYPLAPGNDGSIVTTNAIVRGIDDPDDFAGQCSPLIQIPWQFTCQPYQRLLGRLVQAWQRCYATGRRRRSLLQLFRALEIAFHACRFPSDSLMSVHDAGVRLVLWISAFEILLHPGGQQRIGLPSVLSLIRNLPWQDPQLSRRRYKVTYRNVPPRISLPEVVYYDLYMARNDFGHGNRISRQALRLRRSARAGSLLQLAPLIFRPVLEQRLDMWLPRLRPQPPSNAALRWLLTKAGRRYMQDRAQEWGERPPAEAALTAKARRQP
jgi:hypothetical protein